MSVPTPDHGARRWAALVSLGVGFGMLAGKWTAFGLTGSRAILSDAMESIVHVVATGFAYLSITLSDRPPDPKYPYGYGKIGYFSAGFEGALIGLAACVILVEGVRGMMRGPDLQRLDVGLLITLCASIINLALGRWLIRQGRGTGSLILEADGEHVLTDSYTSFGVVLGVGLVIVTHQAWLDGAVAIAVALNVLRTGYHLVRAGVTGLMDRADPALLARIVGALQRGRREGWNDVHELRAWQAGDRAFIDFHLVVPESWTVGQLHEAINACRAILRAELGESAEVNIHFDPDLPEHSDGRVTGPWTVEDATRIRRRAAVMR